MARKSRKASPSMPLAAGIPQKRIYNAGGYARLSIEDSGNPGSDTIDEQQRLIRNYISKQEDLRFCQFYTDNGHTGTNFERPEFDRLMNDVRSGIIDCIVVKDLSRFGRNYLETGNYLERVFPYINVRFVAINDNFDTLTAERGADGYIIPLKNIINEVYSRDISRKSSSILEAKQKRGEFIGSWAAYGYRKCVNDPHSLEPEEETAQVVRRIFDLRLTGMSYQMIARTLEAENIPSPMRYLYIKGVVKSKQFATSRWNYSGVKNILTNEVYLGHMVQGRKRTGLLEGRKQIVLPKSDWTIVHNTHKAIIDNDTFQSVQSISDDRRRTYLQYQGKYNSLGNTPNLFIGLVYCADCGKRLKRYKNVINHGTKKKYSFICRTHINEPETCAFQSFDEEQLKSILSVVLHHEFDMASNIRAQIEAIQKERNTKAIQDSTEITESSLKSTIEKAGSFMERLFRSYADGLIDEDEFREMKCRYTKEVDVAKAKLADLEDQAKKSSQLDQNAWLKTFSGVHFEELTPELAHEMVERIDIGSDKRINITLRYRNEFYDIIKHLPTLDTLERRAKT